MADMEMNNAETPALSKKQRGRLKKLRKRIQETKQGSETSGLTVSSDMVEWNELMRLVASNDEALSLVVGPSVRIRNDKDDTNWQKAEGAHQRDVLWKMIPYLSVAPKKRKRDKDQPVRIPPWCTLHNPCTVQSVAVVELCLHDNCDWYDIQEHLPIVSSLVDGDEDKSKVALPVETRWFQGNQPKSMTDILIYISRLKESKDEDGIFQSERDVESSDDLLKNVTASLQNLVLKRKDRKKERFPIAVDKRNVHEKREAFQGKVDLPSLKDAKEIVQSCNVEINEDEIISTFVATSQKQMNNDDSKLPRVFALDCEMVQTAKGYELARITLLQLTGVDQSVQDEVSYTVVMDEFVKPYGQILDYKTEYSGVTAAILQDVTTRLEQIQAAVISIVGHDDILLGHSLENDLRALCLVHDTVVDTAVVFRARKERRKYSLRHLSATLLGKKIQSNHGADGHCSEEDAAASLNLAVRRVRVGETFRIKEPGDDKLHLLETISEGSVVCVGPADWLTTHVTPFQTSAHALTCETIADANRKAVVAWLKSQNRRAKLVWARFEGAPKETNASFLSKANDLLSEVTQKMLPGTLLLVSIQSGYAKVAEESKKRKICMDPRSSLGWTAQQEEAYQRLVNDCRSGTVFWIGDSCA